MKQLYIMACLCLLFVSSCREDTIEPDVFGALFGEVVSAGNSVEAIADAQVTTTPPTNSLFTDDVGRFAFESIKAGTYSVRVEKEGYITQLESVTINEDQTTNIVIKLALDTLQNAVPTQAENPMPSDGAAQQQVDLRLSWEASDADENDELRYQLLLFGSDFSQQLEFTDLRDSFVDLQDLEYGATYYWQVIVTDGKSDPVNGDVWSFSTVPFPDLRYLFTRNNNGIYQIISSDANGLEVALTDESNSSWRPLMSPNRQRIAYISNEGVEPQIYLMDRDGGNKQQLTTVPVAGFNNLELDYCWSPDGTQILYMNNSRLFRINTDGTGLEVVASAPSGFTFSECDWTDQGDRILARITGTTVYESYIVMYNREGLFLRQLENDLPGGLGGAVFSIDGRYMLFTRDISGFENTEGRQLDSRVFLKNLDTFELTDLSLGKPNGTNDLDARFSPDGAFVIFVNTNNDGISRRDIYQMRLDGEERELLFEDAEMPNWQ